MMIFLPFSSSASVEITIFRPLSLRARFPGAHVAANPALFGVPSFISPYIGQLFATEPRTACSPLSPDSLRPNFSSSRDGSLPFILLVDRGGCSFTTKVRHAQHIGAIAVIVVNNDNTDPSLIFMSDDGTGRELKTPSVIIKQIDGGILRDAVMASNATGKSVVNQVVMEMRWTLPRADNIVTTELWSSSFEYSSRSLRDAFASIITAFNGNVLYRPRYRIWTPRSLMCDISGLNECENACTNSKRYCAPDPDLPMIGLNGKNVIEEDLRQLCIHQLLNETKNATNIGAGLIYQSRFLGECANAASYSDTCAYGIIDQLQNSGIKISSDAVRQCIRDSGGTTTSNINTILEEEQKKMTQIGVYFTPMLFINDVAYYGSMSCPVPVDISTCYPLKAICSAFKTGAEPRACHTPTGCALGLMRDACGVCGGDGAIDRCGLCLSKSSKRFDQSCKGCDGIPNSGKVIDYCGVCGGNAKAGPCLTSGQIAGIVIGTLIVSGILAVVAYALFRRYQNRMRADVDRLLRQYLPLQEGDTIDRHQQTNTNKRERNDSTGNIDTKASLIDQPASDHFPIPATTRTYFLKNDQEDPDNQL